MYLRGEWESSCSAPAKYIDQVEGEGLVEKIAFFYLNPGQQKVSGGIAYMGFYREKRQTTTEKRQIYSDQKN